MIHRLWVCTSHPVLAWLSFPFHPAAILALVLTASILEARRKRIWAFRLRRLWQSLLIGLVATIALTVLSAWAMEQLGRRGNSAYVAARYAWAVMAWAAAVVGVLWGQRCTPSIGQLARTSAGGIAAFSRRLGVMSASTLLLAIVVRWCMPGILRPFSIPYELAEWFFDERTMSLASDECLAFRSADDLGSWDFSFPSRDAFVLLQRAGTDAVPGVAAYVSDRLAAEERCDGVPCGVDQAILAFLAQRGDHPLLAAYERYPLSAREMRACLHSGHQVKVGGRLGWKCLGTEDPHIIDP